MAVAYASIENSAWQSSSSSVVTKPSGLAVGDIMLGYCAGNSLTSFPSGFTTIGSTSAGGNNYQTFLGWKVADSGDVAASNFTFTFSGSQTNLCALIRITGASIGASTIISSGALASNTGTPSITGITPFSRGNNLLFQLWHGSDSVPSIASYAIATDNPSWTEILDSSIGSTTGVGIAWASRSQVTATGNFSCAAGNGLTDWGGWLVSFTPSLDLSVSESVTMTDGVKNNLGITIRETVALTDNFSGIEGRDWVNDSKPSTLWTQDSI